MRYERLPVLALLAMSLSSACGDGDSFARAGGPLVAQPEVGDAQPDEMRDPQLDGGPDTPEQADGSAESTDSTSDATLSAAVLLMDSGPQAESDEAGPSDSGVSATTVSAQEQMDAGSAATREGVSDGAVDAGDAETDADAAASSVAADATADAAAPDDASATDTDSSDEELHQRFYDKLRSCGYVGPGEFQLRPIQDKYGRCAASCALQTACPLLRGVLCREGTADDYRSCVTNCGKLPVENGFVCGALTIWPSLRCNGANNCRPTGEDEQGCATYACRSGQTLTDPYARCDGRAQCSDGSDEEGCASVCPEAGVASQ